MAYERVCALDDLWEGEMNLFPLQDGRELLFIHLEGGDVRAFDPSCPHQNFPLLQGSLDGAVLTCPAHLWQFDVRSGQGVNPKGCRLKGYPVKVEGDAVFVDVAAEAEAAA